MLGLVPFVCLGCMILAVHSFLRRRSPGADWRFSVLAGTICWGGLVYAVTETLSLFKAISFPCVLITWTVLTLASLALWVRLRKPESRPDSSVESPPPPERLRWWHYSLLGLGAVILLILLVIAIVSPPNNWDSQIYHLARVEHWVLNRSVEHYPTHIIRQLYLSPFPEYVVLQVRLLGHSDRLAALVQYGSMLGCLVAVSLAAKLLGSRLNGQVFAPLLCLTLPMGILQATSTQTDYVSAFALVSLIVFLLQARIRPALPLFGLAGLAMGLALLTKVVTLLYAAPFALWLAAIGIRRLRWRAWKPALLIAALCLAVNLPSQWRNIETFGTLTSQERGSDGKSNILADGITPGSIMSNVLRNFALHLGSPCDRLNKAVVHAVAAVHDWWGLPLNAPGATFETYRFDVPVPLSHEDNTPNSLHMLIGLGAIVTIVAYRPLRARRELLVYFLCLVGGLVIFSAVLRWQPWHSRLHLPLFVMGIPLAAVAMDRLPKAFVGVPLVLGLMLVSYPWVMKNAIRPVLGDTSIFRADRTAVCFVQNPNAAAPYYDAIQQMKEHSCTELGLICGPRDWDYPLWVLMRQAQMEPRVIHVRVTNESGKLWGGKYSADPPTPPPRALLIIQGDLRNGGKAIFKITDGKAWPPEADGK